MRAFLDTYRRNVGFYSKIPMERSSYWFLTDKIINSAMDQFNLTYNVPHSLSQQSMKSIKENNTSGYILEMAKIILDLNNLLIPI